MTGVDVEHTKALTDAEIDADLVGDGGMYFEPDAGYPEYGNDTVRWAYRLGVDAGGAAVPALVAAVERVQALADDLESRAAAIEEANPTHTTQIALHRQHAAMIRQALETKP